MSEYLKIFKGGILKLFKGDEEKHNKYRIKGNWNIVDRNTKEVYQTFDDPIAADNFFYSEVPIDLTWHNMRSLLYLEEGVTPDDIIKVINNDEWLLSFVRANYPEYGLSECKTWIKTTPETGIFVHMYAEIDGQNNLEYRPEFSLIPEKGDFVVDSGVSVYRLADDYRKFGHSLDLLELIQILGDAGYFGVQPYSTNLTIKKDGIHINESARLIDPLKEYPESAFDFLLCPCEIDEDVTLGDIFEIVGRDDILSSFVSSYAWCNVKKFHEAAKLPCDKKENDDEKLWFLEVYRFVSCFSESDFDFTASFHGKGEDQNYAIELTPVNELIHLPVHLNKKFRIYKEDIDKNSDENAEHIDVNCNYNLLDILDAIYFEISFFGDPDDVSKTKNDLTEQVSRIKAGLEETKSFTSVEEMLKELDEDDDLCSGG